MLLSVLVPSTHTRWNNFALDIQASLFAQYAALTSAQRAQVEILVVTDTKARTIGQKRDDMLQMAQGDYVAFVDDDDRVAPDYIESLLTACAADRDVVTFLASVSINGQPPKICRYSLDYETDHNTATEYHRLPNHLCAVRRTLALEIGGYNPMQRGEDSDYAKRLRSLLQTEWSIDRVLYHYDFNSESTETQCDDPVVDIVFLSRGWTEELRAMTQTAIDSCVAGLSGRRATVTVLEQIEGVRYDNAETQHVPFPFAYNRFANLGAASGTSEWIMICNNDLQFHANWLAPLLAAGSDVVSPKCPNERRQASVRRIERGVVNGRHFSGWCFMIRRSLWEKIGGFDEDFSFWCADDAVIEQVRAAGVTPAVVPASKVLHLGSITHKATADDDGERTWAQVDKFERKYGVVKFAGDARYTNWKAKNENRNRGA